MICLGKIKSKVIFYFNTRKYSVHAPNSASRMVVVIIQAKIIIPSLRSKDRKYMVNKKSYYYKCIGLKKCVGMFL